MTFNVHCAIPSLKSCRKPELFSSQPSLHALPASSHKAATKFRSIGSDLAEPGITMAELHSNFTAHLSNRL